jgi:hypothetical protein
MARWLLTFRAMDPTNVDNQWEVGVSEGLYRYLQNNGHEKAIARLLLVRDVLEGGTTSIYRGWSWPDKDECFVYEGRPSRDYKSLTIDTPAPKRMVFLVFVLPDGAIDDWTWRPVAEEGENRPDGIAGELVWSVNRS